jgi:hypothetical protein
MKFTNLEKLLPFGYLIIVVLGIVKESVFYYQLGINILRYSNLMDVLLSPISDLTSHPLILFSLVGYVLLAYLWYSYLSRHPESKWANSFLKTNNLNYTLSEEELKIRVGNQFLGFLILGVMAFFLGVGIGNGRAVAKKIANGQVKYKNTITYNSGETKQVYLIGSNSANYFYVEQGNRNVQISPVGAVKTIEYLKDGK